MTEAHWRAIWDLYRLICAWEGDRTAQGDCRHAACAVLADAEACRCLLELLELWEASFPVLGADAPPGKLG